MTNVRTPDTHRRRSDDCYSAGRGLAVASLRREFSVQALGRQSPGRAQQLGFHVGVRWEIGRGHILIEEAYAIAKATQVQDTRTDRAYTAIAGGVSW